MSHPPSDGDRPDDHDHHGAGAGHDDFGDLARDLRQMMGRRRALALLGGAGVVGLLAGCARSTDRSGAVTSQTTTTAVPATDATTTATTAPVTATGGADVVASAGAEIPDETAGPYPSDGSNGPNVLVEDGIVRSDLTTSIGDLSGTADGVPLTVALTVVVATTGSPRPGATVYLWHCTADGRYSMYEITDQNYLRGVQVADDSGHITFRTIFPGCYAGRWPHLHFQVFEDPADATAGAQATKTSQLALPQADCETVYTDGRYGSSSGNLARLSLTGDMVFADGWTDQLAAVTGDPTDGYTASLLVRV